MGKGGNDGWCILRTSGRHTLALAEDLNKSGFEAWTPISSEKQPMPKGKGMIERRASITPTFVFARAKHIPDLVSLAKTDNGFSVFYHYGHLAIIADAELDALRQEEATAIPRSRDGSYRAGDPVRVVKGIFEGMCGVVEFGDSHKVKVWLSLFGRCKRVEISPFFLEPDGVEGLRLKTDGVSTGAQAHMERPSDAGRKGRWPASAKVRSNDAAIRR